MNQLYPLKFYPQFKEKIWGGQKIRTHLGLDFTPLANCGEAWVLSGIPGNESVVSEGWLKGNNLNELVEVYMDELLGEKVYEKHAEEFPLLVKIIDSNDWLSLQVHPDDKYAAEKDIGSGKTEMWYVLQADEGAELITGFKQQLDKKLFLSHLQSKSLSQVLNIEKVAAGDVFFIPAGRVHALGPGILFAEIQQSSDTTFRIYDYDRVDSQGKLRDLHLKQALDIMDFNVYSNYRTQYKASANKTTPLVDCPYFTTILLHLNSSVSRNYEELDSFVIYLCVQGKVSVHYQDGASTLQAGECLLIPASFSQITLTPSGEAQVLESYIP